jgi:hypothetical protein
MSASRTTTHAGRDLPRVRELDDGLHNGVLAQGDRKGQGREAQGVLVWKSHKWWGRGCYKVPRRVLVRLSTDDNGSGVCVWGLGLGARSQSCYSVASFFFHCMVWYFDKDDTR